ncbi:MAG: flavodoxin [Thermofilaceae archaeon]
MPKQVLIAYYSWSGNTRRLAQTIHKIIGGKLFEVEPATPYPSSYNATVEQARREIQSGYRPQLKAKLASIEPYSVVFIGSPNWWGTIAPPIAAFLSEYDLSGKVVIPFFTHGGGGMQNMLTDLKKLCLNSRVLEPFLVQGSRVGAAEKSVSEWLHRIKVSELVSSP